MLSALLLALTAIPALPPASGELPIPGAFATASAEPSASAQTDLRALATMLAAYGAAASATVRIREDGEEAKHPGLGGQRAQAALELLASAGLARGQLSAVALPPDAAQPPLSVAISMRPERVGYQVTARAQPGSPTRYETVGPLKVGDRVVLPADPGGPGGGVRLELSGGSRVRLLRPSGMAVVAAQPAPARAVALELVAGRAEVEVPPGGAAVRVGGPTAAVTVREGEVRILRNEAQLEVAVLRGEARLTSPRGDLAVPAGQLARVSSAGDVSLSALPEAPVALAPLRGQANPARLSAKGAEPLKVEVATDADFDALAASAPAPGGQAQLELPPGRYYWRAVSGEGAAQRRSPVFGFTVPAVLMEGPR